MATDVDAPAGPACPLCGGRCAGADLTALLQPELAWVWGSVAHAADRRGDPDVVDGSAVTLTAPDDPQDRAAAAGLFPGRPLTAGQVRRVAPSRLTQLVQRWGPGLTPGAVAAHAMGRPLAARAAARAALSTRVDSLRETLLASCRPGGALDGRGEEIFQHLRRSAWIARIDRAGGDREVLRRAVQTADLVCGIAPEERRDRRRLVPGDPHALDDGTLLAGLTLAVLTAVGRLPPGARGPRQSWDLVGVDCDEVQGGLSSLGVHPAGWTLPPGVLCTLPPRELRRCGWPVAGPDGRVFVTENPSVLAAAADAVAGDPAVAGRARLICTMGTPSGAEIRSLALLAAQGWQLWVRADFDAAGVRHVGSLLAGVPGSRPWRMGTSDYLGGLGTAQDRRDQATCGPSVPTGRDRTRLDTPWEPELGRVMAQRAVPVYEEALMPLLLSDLTGSQHVLR